MKKNNYQAMVLASFAADSLAMGAHWIYDTKKLQTDLGRVEDLLAPLPGSYHAGKQKGEFTHYGDQALVLLQTLASHGSFNLTRFSQQWQKAMRSYNGYMDHATKKTLTQLDAGKDEHHCGSSSTDLGGAARIAPLLFSTRSNEDLVKSFCREQTAFTHNSRETLLAAEFLCSVTWQVLHGKNPRAAIEQVLETGIHDIALELRIRNSLDSDEVDTETFIKQCGQACGMENALPGVMHLVITYQENLEQALIENVMAGGDSAARGLAAGMILGAYQGLDGIPQRWLEQLSARAEINRLLTAIELS